MSDVKNKSLSTIDQLVSQPYKYGFETEIENERIPVGLDENTVRLLSEKRMNPNLCGSHDCKRLKFGKN